MLGPTFSIQLGSLQLCLSLHSAYTSLKFSQKWELRTFLVLPWAGKQSWAFAWPSRVPGICWSFSKPLRTSHSSVFPFKLFDSSLVALTVIHCPWQWQLWYHRQCHSRTFEKYPLRETFSIGYVWVRSQKDKTFKWSLPENEGLKELQPSLLLNYWECGMLFFKAAMELWYRGHGLG